MSLQRVNDARVSQIDRQERTRASPGLEMAAALREGALEARKVLKQLHLSFFCYPLWRWSRRAISISSRTRKPNSAKEEVEGSSKLILKCSRVHWLSRESVLTSMQGLVNPASAHLLRIDLVAMIDGPAPIPCAHPDLPWCWEPLPPGHKRETLFFVCAREKGAVSRLCLDGSLYNFRRRFF